MADQLSFTKRILNAGAWSLFGQAFGMILRFGSNLILTRLLYPEAFGLMAIIQATITGLSMFVDLGIPHCIIRREHEPDVKFRHAAWTFQIIQGLIIGFGIWISAPFIQSIYNQPLLGEMAPFVGLNAVINGFSSTRIAILNRKLKINKIIQFEALSNFVSIAVTIVLAWIWPSVWSLVWGGVAGNLFKTFSSHIFLEGERDSLGWDKKCFRELFDFGKWIIARSGMTFLDGEGNKLLLGLLLGIKNLSFFNIASTLNLMVIQVVLGISGRVLISVYSEVLRERAHQIHSVLAKCRLVFIATGWLSALTFIFFGDAIVHLLYDQRYTDSGYMLRILGMGSLVGIITNSYSHLLTAKGMIRRSTALLFFKIIIQIASISIGYIVFGEAGVILGLAFGEWIYFPINSIGYSTIGLWQPKIDLLLFTIALIIVILVFQYSELQLPVNLYSEHKIDFNELYINAYDKAIIYMQMLQAWLSLITSKIAEIFQ